MISRVCAGIRKQPDTMTVAGYFDVRCCRSERQPVNFVWQTYTFGFSALPAHYRVRVMNNHDALRMLLYKSHKMLKILQEQHITPIHAPYLAGVV